MLTTTDMQTLAMMVADEVMKRIAGTIPKQEQPVQPGSFQARRQESLNELARKLARGNNAKTT